MVKIKAPTIARGDALSRAYLQTVPGERHPSSKGEAEQPGRMLAGMKTKNKTRRKRVETAESCLKSADR